MSQAETGHRVLDPDDLLALCTALQVLLQRLLISVDDDHLQALGLR